MKTHHGEVNAVFNKAFSSFALYEGKNGGDFVPYQCSSRYHHRDRDSKFVLGLRKWLADFQVDEGKMTTECSFVSITLTEQFSFLELLF